MTDIPPQHKVPHLPAFRGRVLKRSSILDGTIPTFWYRQDSLLTHADDFFGSRLYAPPTGWPAAGAVLRVPRFLWWQVAGLPFGDRLAGWTALAQAVSAQVQALSPTPVDWAVSSLGPPSTVPGLLVSATAGNWLMGTQPPARFNRGADPTAFLGTDVLIVVIAQDLGLMGAYPNGSTVTQALIPTATIAAKAQRLTQDLAYPAQTFKSFQRYGVLVYYDDRTIVESREAATLGGRIIDPPLTLDGSGFIAAQPDGSGGLFYPSHTYTNDASVFQGTPLGPLASTAYIDVKTGTLYSVYSSAFLHNVDVNVWNEESARQQQQLQQACTQNAAYGWHYQGTAPVGPGPFLADISRWWGL